MYSRLILASIVLPSVIGQCCLPDTIKATVMFELEDPSPKDFVIDFKQNKLIYKPWNHSHFDSVLFDMNTDTAFLIGHDGVCHIREMDQASRYFLVQCLPKEAKKGLVFLGPMNGWAVQTYELDHGGVRSVYGVNDECFPVVFITESPGEPLTVNFWTNVSTNITDLSALDVDVSNCIEEAEVVG